MTHRRSAAVAASTALVVVAGYAGCSGDGETAAGANNNQGGATSAQGGNNAGNGGDVFTTSGPSSGGAGGDDNCAEVTSEATLTSRPVDIIVAVDNSGSMSGEISEVEVQLTQNFSAILDAAVPPIDYRVIMVARHGQNGSQSICIAEPLGTVPDTDMDGHCDSVPSQPTDNTRFFHHSVEINSHNALCRFREQFDVADEFDLHSEGYKTLLRDDSFKFFLVITDDRVDTGGGCPYDYDDQNSVLGGENAANAWDADMLALSPLHFGTATERNYTFWSIVALGAFNPTMAKPYGDPHPPSEPITLDECAESPACDPSCAVNPGTGYQALSILTGGFRYPTCPVEYSEIFGLMAQGVIEGAQVECEIPLPEPPAGQTPDLNSVEVDYTSEGSLVEGFTRIDDPADCDAHSFYIQDESIILCPEACGVVQGDENAKLDVSYQCGGPPQ